MPKKELLHQILIKFDADFHSTVADMEIYFAAALYNQLWGEYMAVYFSNFNIYEAEGERCVSALVALEVCSLLFKFFPVSVSNED